MTWIFNMNQVTVPGVVMLLLPLASIHAASSPKEILATASSQYDRGDYQQALLTLKSIDIRNHLDNSDDMKLAFKIRAVASEEIGDHEGAVETIRELFFLDPNYVFDPFDTPQSVVSLAQKESLRIQEKNKHLAQVVPDNKTNGQETPRIHYIEKPPHLSVVLFPFGLNHFIMGSSVKGGVYLSLQSLGTLANVAAFWWKHSYLDGLGTSRLHEGQNRGRFETAQTVQFLGLAAALLSYGISVADAFMSFKSL